MKLSVISSIILLSTLFDASTSKEFNKLDFRSGLFTTVYEKAAMRLTTPDAQKLLAEMRPLDIDYMTAKMEHQSLDKVKKSLRKLLDGYRCGDIFDSLEGGKDGIKKTNLDENSQNSRSEPEFYDPRAAKMWADAVSGGKFSPDELESLQQELLHYDQKAFELHQRHNETDIGQDNHLHSDSENVIPSDLKLQKQHLNKKFQAIEQNVKSAHLKSEKAKALWLRALESSLTNDELLLLKEELVHFDKSLEKLAYFSERANNLDEKAPDIKHVSDKVSSLGKKVEKHEKLLMSRLKHNEL